MSDQELIKQNAAAMELQKPVDDGLLRDLPFDEYLRLPYLSQSVLKQGQKSMAALKAAMDESFVRTPTDDMLLGSALHVTFLEPEKLLERVVKWEGKVRRGKEWDAFCDDNADKIILTPSAYAKMAGMIQSLRRHPVVREWLSRIQDVEVSCVDEINDVEMKGRVDALTDDPLIDLKKVADTDPNLFRSKAVHFGYHIQAATYMRLFNRSRFILVCVESQPPYEVVPYELSTDFVGMGEDELMRLTDEYKRCKESGVWPGRSESTVMLEPPSWMTEEAESRPAPPLRI